MARMIRGRCRKKNGQFAKLSGCKRGRSKGLSGTVKRSRCRDKFGVFVPVPQCLRRKGANVHITIVDAED